MDQKKINQCLETIRTKPAVLVLIVLLCWFAFFIALLSGSEDDSVVAPEYISGIEDAPLSGKTVNPASTDSVGVDPLDQAPPTFNIAELTMPRLESVIENVFSLEFNYPDEAKDVQTVALEKGGSPLGQILTELLAPYDYSVFGQEKSITVVPAKYPERDAADKTVTSTIEYDPAKPLTLWLATRPALKVEIGTQTLISQSSEEKISLNILASYGLNPVLHTALDVAVDHSAEVSAAASRKLRLKFIPRSVAPDKVTLEVSVEVSSGS